MSSSFKSAVVVPARLESTRLQRKLIQDIVGTPVIVRTVNQCKLSVADDVFVATDSSLIADLLKPLDVKVFMTDVDIKTGTDRVASAVRQISQMNGGNYDVVVNVQGDEPFIEPAVINTLIKNFADDSKVYVNTACVKIKDNDIALDPNVVKVIRDCNSDAIYFSRHPIPYNRDKVDGVEYYKHLGIYGFRSDFLLKYVNMQQGYYENIEKLEQLRILERGYKIRVLEVEYDSIGIDTINDLEHARVHAKK